MPQYPSGQRDLPCKQAARAFVGSNPTCGTIIAQFELYTYINNIMMIERRVKMYLCKICEKEFNTVESMNAHQIVHKNGPRYTKSRTKEKPIKICACCATEYSGKKTSLYCSIKCQQEFQYKERIQNWHNITPHKKTIKRWLSETYGNQCSVCGISDWNNKPIILELEHKDGNSENNSKENLCLICPNCHSQTDTYKGKNKGNGRHYRRQRYKEGKSF